MCIKAALVREWGLPSTDLPLISYKDRSNSFLLHSPEVFFLISNFLFDFHLVRKAVTFSVREGDEDFERLTRTRNSVKDNIITLD